MRLGIRWQRDMEFVQFHGLEYQRELVA